MKLVFPTEYCPIKSTNGFASAEEKSSVSCSSVIGACQRLMLPLFVRQRGEQGNFWGIVLKLRCSLQFWHKKMYDSQETREDMCALSKLYRLAEKGKKGAVVHNNLRSTGQEVYISEAGVKCREVHRCRCPT